MRRGAPWVDEEMEPDRRAGSNPFCFARSSSSDMMPVPSSSLPSTDAGVDFEIGGMYGWGVWRIEGSGVGRCRPEEVEKCEVLEVERLCRWRPLTGVKVTSVMDRE